MPGAGDRGGAALAAKGEPIAVEEPSTLPVATITTVAGEQPRTRPARSKRRDTADEAKSLRRAMPGGPVALDQASETVRDRCPVQETAVARRLPPRVGPPAVDESSTPPVGTITTVAGERQGRGPERRSAPVEE